MKREQLKKPFWQTLFSAIVLGIFLFFGAGSLTSEFSTTSYIGSSTYGNEYETIKYLPSGTITTKGFHDGYGRWQGRVRIVSTNLGGRVIEEVNMKDGRRDGESTTMWQDGTITSVDYKNGWVVNENKSVSDVHNTANGYEIFSTKYPFYYNQLISLGIADEKIKEYVDNIENLLSDSEFEPAEFDDYYQDAVDELDGRMNDSIAEANSLLALFRGIELIKNSEFRLAVIDRYKSGNPDTYEIVKTSYQNYLLTLNEFEVINEDFNEFCVVFDGVMDSYGLLDLEDPFLIDSLDSRMYRAIDSMTSEEESLLANSLAIKSAAIAKKYNKLSKLIRIVNPWLTHLRSNSAPGEVAGIVASLILIEFSEANLMRNSVYEAYLLKKGINRLPIVTTELTAKNSATNITIGGNVIEDGGADVSERGIVWALVYNPTMANQSKNLGDGKGSFSTTIDGLSEGKTYYARAYAKNEVGTVYGNCLSFVASLNTGILENEIRVQDLNIFPNPTSGLTTFRFNLESTDNMILKIVNVNGQLVLENDLGLLSKGENLVQLNLSNFENGIYNCKLTNNKTLNVSRKILIVH